jgi:hypothetical protein
VALPPDLQQGISEFREQLVSDQGGISELSGVRAGLVRLLVGAETAFRVAGNELTRCGGISTPSGRLAFDRLLAAMTTWTRIAEKLGIERRAKAAPDIRDWWDAHSQAAGQEAER